MAFTKSERKTSFWAGCAFHSARLAVFDRGSSEVQILQDNDVVRLKSISDKIMQKELR